MGLEWIARSNGPLDGALTSVALSGRAPLIEPADGEAFHIGIVSAGADTLPNWQRTLYGTTAWHASFGRRAIVEMVNSQIHGATGALSEVSRGCTKQIDTGRITLFLAHTIAGYNHRVMQNWIRDQRPEVLAFIEDRKQAPPPGSAQESPQPLRRPSSLQHNEPTGPLADTTSSLRPAGATSARPRRSREGEWPAIYGPPTAVIGPPALNLVLKAPIRPVGIDRGQNCEHFWIYVRTRPGRAGEI